MKRVKPFTSAETGALAFAIVLIAAGLIRLVWPREAVVVHATNDVVGWPGALTETVTRAGSRVYGVLPILFGGGLAAFALCRGKT